MINICSSKMVNMNVDFCARILLWRAYLSVSYPWPCPGDPVAIIPSVALPLPPVLQEVLWVVSPSSVHHALTLSPRRPARCTQCPCLSGGDWFPLLSCQLSPSGAARQIVMLGKVGICPKLPSRCAERTTASFIVPVGVAAVSLWFSEDGNYWRQLLFLYKS